MGGRQGVMCEYEKKSNFGTYWSMFFRYKMIENVKYKFNFYTH